MKKKVFALSGAGRLMRLLQHSASGTFPNSSRHRRSSRCCQRLPEHHAGDPGVGEKRDLHSTNNRASGVLHYPANRPSSTPYRNSARADNDADCEGVSRTEHFLPTLRVSVPLATT
jgi:hypothetical protein